MDKKQTYNFEVSDNNFEQIVLHNSHTLPVLVLFMSPSDPVCIALENTLINYASEFAGQLILARYDMDMYTHIAQQYKITKLPTIAMVQNAAIEYQTSGHPSEADLIALFKRFNITNPAEELRLQGAEKHAQGDIPAAVQLLTQGIKLDPSNTKIAMDMCQIFLDQNMLAEAAELFTKLPNKDKENATGRFLIGQITFKKLALDTAGKTALQEAKLNSPDDINVGFDLAICYIANQQYQEGMNELLALLKLDPNAKEGGAQELAIATLRMLELKHPQTASKLRQQMGNLLSE